MWYGWTGAGLEVDLSRRKVKKSEGDRETYRNYLGAHALVHKLFWDRVPPEVEPFSADNLLIFGAGPLVGTAAPTACRTTMVTRSVITNYLASASMAGFWGPELKFAGYDTLIISGKSSSPVYIYIHNDKIEVRDASHLWGKDVYQTQKLIREELKDEKVQSLCIGPAGENRVFFADIGHGPGCSMSRGGAGAVMGDKKLKAIAVRGTQSVNIARPESFLQVCEDIMGRSAFVDSEMCARWPDPEKGTLYLNTLQSMEHRTYRNFEFKRPWKESARLYLEHLAARKALMLGCFNCQQPCITAVHLPDGETIFYKCHSRHRYMTAGDIQDFDFNLRCFALIQRYGMDSDSASNILRLAIDLYQKGILTKEDTGGLVLEWGNPEVVPALLEKITYRKDIGDVLADGAYRATCQIGKGAEQYICCLRKLEISELDGSDISSVVRALIHDRQGFGRWWDNWAGYDDLVQNLKDPEEIKRLKKHLAIPRERFKVVIDTEIDGEILSKMLAYDAESGIIQDGCGLCRNKFKKDANLKKTNGVAFDVELLSHATGLDVTEEEARKCARRSRALLRAYNAILGERMKASDLPASFLPKHLLPNNRAFLSQAIAETNQAMGYDAEGIPRKDHLEELGLGDVAQDLERRGILPELVPVPISRKLDSQSSCCE